MAIERRTGPRPFLARVYLNGQKGPSRAFHTRYEAEAWEAAARLAIANGDPVPGSEREVTAKTMTVLDACRDTVRAMKAGAVRSRSGRALTPGSVDSYERRLRLHVVPHIGGMLVAEVDRATVIRLRETLLATSASLARTVTDALRLVMRRMVDHGFIPTNPVVDLQPLSVEEHPTRYLTRDEARLLRSHADSHPHPRLGLFVHLALSTGARRGELEALTWENVRGRAIHVHEAEGNLDRITRKPAPPKSKAGVRSIPVGPRLWARLEVARGEGPVVGRLPWRAWRDVQPPGCRVHDLRHTAATFWLAAGMNVHEVAALLGHGDAVLVLRRYGHALPDRVNRAGEVMEAFMDGGAFGGVDAPPERTSMDEDA